MVLSQFVKSKLLKEDLKCTYRHTDGQNLSDHTS